MQRGWILILKEENGEADEDVRLCLALRAYAPADKTTKLPWAHIQNHIPNRTDVQCRERYCNVANPNLQNEVKWTAEEDEKLLMLAEKYKTADGKYPWSAICKELTPRTDNHCWRRWKSLNNIGSAETETKKKKKKKAKFDGNPRPVKKTKPTPKIPEFPLQQFIAEFPTPYVTSASPAPIIPTFEVPASPAPDAEIIPVTAQVPPTQILVQTVLPTTESYHVLHRMLRDLDQDESMNVPALTEQQLEEILATDQFRSLQAHFNGLLLFPTLVTQELGFLNPVIPNETVQEPIVIEEPMNLDQNQQS